MTSPASSTNTSALTPSTLMDPLTELRNVSTVPELAKSLSEAPSEGTTANESSLDPLKTAQGVYITIHGHFYQPPRENPYLDAVERQPSAEPFHDWNARIHHECYRPNAFARVFNDQGHIVRIVNNFEYLSFNIGPTLINWLEQHDPETYKRILDADRRSCARLNGHGNAIAQVYNHIIMPLANDRDKLTQIRWGKADFRSRFGREPEGMWLAETAIDAATLTALVHEGIKFVILAPSQAWRCRPIPTAQHPNPNWQTVEKGEIDATCPYRWFLRPETDPDNVKPQTDGAASPTDQSGHAPVADLPYIDLFFYDGPISGDMGFSDVLKSSNFLAARVGKAVRHDNRPCQLISVATDGETFGHHKKDAEKTLAYAFAHVFPQQGWTVTNFAHYLSLVPPTWEVELKPVTAWSCAHGVGRWQDDCGCASEKGVWHQRWRRPLREALNWLRDQLIEIYEVQGRTLFRDPWAARDAYIEVIRDRRPETGLKFLATHAARDLTIAEQVQAFSLLEMQRHALLMFTSCGWFFEELSRLEGTQILRYAARALELAAEVAGASLAAEFSDRLGLAPSNLQEYKDGAGVYRKLVQPFQIGWEQIAAQYAISTLFGDRVEIVPTPGGGLAARSQLGWPYQDIDPILQSLLDAQVVAPNHCAASIHLHYCYYVRSLDHQVQRIGTLQLAVGEIQALSNLTWESRHLCYAVLHLGGWELQCCLQPFSSRAAYNQMKDALFAALNQASASSLILVLNQHFEGQTYNLADLPAEERHRVMQRLSEDTLRYLDQLYRQVYQGNYGMLLAFQREELAVPQELQVAAEVALTHRTQVCLDSLIAQMIQFPRLLEPEATSMIAGSPVAQSLNTFARSELGKSLLAELEAIASEAETVNCTLRLPNAAPVLEHLLNHLIHQVLYHFDLTHVLSQIHAIERLLTVAERLGVILNLDRIQELYFYRFNQQIAPLCLGWMQSQTSDPTSRSASTAPSQEETADPSPPAFCGALTIDHVHHLLLLGQRLMIDVSAWLHHLKDQSQPVP